MARTVTAPRQITKGVSWLITRRCTQREFLLKPSLLTNLIFKFVLAVAAARYGILIHAVCVMSDHYHLVLTDPHADLPGFNQFLDGVLAKALNALYGRWENLWAPSSYSAVRLETPDDIARKTAYVLANPASAHLVERGREWPGVWSDPRLIGEPGERVERPGHYFAKDGTMPEAEVLVLSVPRGFASAEEFRTRVLTEVQALERAAAAEREANGTCVVGAHRVLKQKITDRATSFEARRRLNPRIAAGDKWRRIEAIQRLKEFLLRYRDALLRYVEGKRDTIFPPGTYLMRVRFGVACASS